MIKQSSFQAIEWTDAGLRLLDQRSLPHEQHYICLQDAVSVAEAIRDMVVRGAPAIGITAAYAVVLLANAIFASSIPAAIEPISLPI